MVCSGTGVCDNNLLAEPQRPNKVRGGRGGSLPWAAYSSLCAAVSAPPRSAGPRPSCTGDPAHPSGPRCVTFARLICGRTSRGFSASRSPGVAATYRWSYSCSSGRRRSIGAARRGRFRRTSIPVIAVIARIVATVATATAGIARTTTGLSYYSPLPLLRTKAAALRGCCGSRAGGRGPFEDRSGWAGCPGLHLRLHDYCDRP